MLEDVVNARAADLNPNITPITYHLCMKTECPDRTADQESVTCNPVSALVFLLVTSRLLPLSEWDSLPCFTS